MYLRGRTFRCKSELLHRGAGFTLPELVITLVVISILAAVIVPRFVQKSDFDVFGYSEQTREVLRAAQKSAVAKRRRVCVTLVTNGISSIQFASSFGASSCNQSLINPSTGQAYGASTKDAAPSGVAITATSFNFDALGRPSFSTPQVLSVTGGSSVQTITIEAETGYVH